MSDTDDTGPRPARDHSADPWALGHETWRFHRWFFAIVGRPSERGEYSHLLKQVRWRHEEKLVVAGVYRLAMRDGSPILVTAKPGMSGILLTVLPPDWQIGDKVSYANPPRRRAQPDAAPPPPEPAPPAPEPPAPRKLTLGGKNAQLAATLLEDRLRRWG